VNRTAEDNLADVSVLGRIGYDLFAVEQNRPLAEVEHFSRHLGGSSANIAVGLVEGYNTSLCLTEVSPPDQFLQVFYRQRPADQMVSVGEPELAYIRRSRMFVTNGTVLASSPSREAALESMKAAHQAGVRVVLDIDYRASSWSSPEEAGAQAGQALPWVDVVIGNEDEVGILTGESERLRQVKKVLDRGDKLLILKLGAKGVEAYRGDQRFSADPCPVPVTSTIGAGDGFAAGFLYALFQNLPLDLCLRYGNAAAAVVVSRVSCSDAMPTLDELRARLTSSVP